jgi:cytochrome c oxidase subunit 2
MGRGAWRRAAGSDRRRTSWDHVLSALGLSTLGVLAVSCGGPASTLAPAGPGAEQIAALWWVLFGVATAVYAIVVAAMLFALCHRRPAGRAEVGPLAVSDLWPTMGIVAGGIVFPLIVVTALFLVSVRTLGTLVTREPADLAVEIVAHQWWWELLYRPAGGEPVMTANELHLPVGRVVEIRLRSVDVIHSFWVPALQGKLDAVPGKTNVTWLQASRPGTFHGQCAEYCGIQHALMQLAVIAQPAEEFQAWLAMQRRAAAEPTGETGQRGQRLFLTHCAHCHTVRGTVAFFGRTAPDLTHVAGRRSLAAGTLRNVKGNLAGWIADPQTHKPGARMPRVPLAAEEFHAVVDYISSLR